MKPTKNIKAAIRKANRAIDRARAQVDRPLKLYVWPNLFIHGPFGVGIMIADSEKQARKLETRMRDQDSGPMDADDC